MKNRDVKFISHAALIAALYVALTYGQNLLIPNSTSWVIQFRTSEALCVLAFFTPSAIAGLTVGCLLFNISNAGALPLDFLVGTLATFLSVGGMYLTRKWTIKGYPVLGMLLPGLCNALLVGWELSLYIGNSLFINGLYVAIGEVAVLLTLGSLLYYAIKSRGLDTRLF
jgi:uncharacterized membrane protein